MKSSICTTLIVILLALTYSPLTSAQSPLDIVPLTQVTHTAQTSGNWTSASTWGGNLPSNGAHVHIPNGIAVTINGLVSERIKTLRLDGQLDFLTSVPTELKVETIIGSGSGELTIGTASNPIPDGVTAKITFIDEGAIDLNWDFQQFSKGMVMMGKTTVFGAPKSSWHELQTAPLAGTTSITLAAAPTNWQVGDEIVITGTIYNNPESDEKRAIHAITGNTITLNQALSLDHQTPSSALKVHVANLSRNILFASENSTVDRRGHIMFMHNLDVDIHYARFYQLGRTNKQVQVDDWFFPTLVADEFFQGDRTNIRGRYSCHFHRGGVNPATTTPATVKGCVVEDDPGWAYVNHSSHVDFMENVSYNVVGGAFQTESGDEIGSFQRNIAIRTVNPDYPILNPDTEPVDIREDSQDFAFQGDGYWIHGGGVSLTDNIASGSSGHGFIFWTEGQREVGTPFDLQNMFKVSNIPNGNLLPNVDNIQSWWIPLKEFKGNTTYSSSKGLAAYYVHATLFEDITDLTPAYLETVHSTFEDLTIWNVRTYGIELQNCERFTFKNLNMYNEGDPDVIGIFNTITVARESNWIDCEVQGFGIGMIPAMQGNIHVCGGTFANRWDFLMVPPQRDSRAPAWDRDILIDGVSFQNSPFFNANDLIPFKMEGASTLQAAISFVEQEFQNRFFLIPDRIRVNVEGLTNKRLFYNEQAANYTPITDENIYDASGAFVNDVLNKTNQALFDDLQLSFAGALLPTDAVNHPAVSGGKVSHQDPTMNFPICHFLDEPLAPANTYDGFDFYDCWNATSNKVAGTSSPYTPPTCSPSTPDPLQVHLTLFLEGAYDANTGLMRTDLLTNGLLPTTQPFAVAPWNYQGTDSVATPADFPTNTVDWVLVEIRDAANNFTVVEQKAALLLANGSIVDVTTTAGVLFPTLTAGTAYYISVKTRHHLAIMSNSAITLPNLTPFNLSDVNNVLGGATQVEEVATGIYALLGGDVNGDGIISVADFNRYVAEIGGTNVYAAGDVEVDGNVTVDDFNVYQFNSSRIGVAQIRY